MLCKLLVRKEGLEPSRCYPPDPKSGASANSATFALPCSILIIIDLDGKRSAICTLPFLAVAVLVALRTFATAATRTRRSTALC